jgi:hypothetical protein
MLVETVIQVVAPMLLELAFREVAVPAAKKLVRQGAERQDGQAAAVPATAEQARLDLTPMLSPVQMVRVVSAIPGRVRVDVAGLNGQDDLAQKLNEEIGALAGVTQAAASSRTGRMLVTYDAQIQTADVLLAAIDRTRALNLNTGSRTRHLAAVV